MYMRPPAKKPVSLAAGLLSRVSSIVLTALTLLLVWLEVYPASFIQFIQTLIIKSDRSLIHRMLI